MADALLTINNVVKRFDDTTILDGISFSVKKSEVIVIVGPSGCGKSTLLRCINALEPIQEGSITLDGDVIERNSKTLPLLRQRIGMVFQSYDLFPHLTVLDNILLAPCKVQKRDKEEVKQEAMSLLERVGLKEKAKSYPRELSGGQKQRVLIARALCATDKLLILDEPITGLDPSAILDFYQLIRKLNQEEKVAILMVSHDMANIVHQGGKILQMRQKPLFWGTMKEYVKSEIAHSFLGREELATLGHRCGVPMQKDGIRKMQKPEMGSETDSETKQHLKDRNAEKEV